MKKEWLKIEAIIIHWDLNPRESKKEAINIITPCIDVVFKNNFSREFWWRPALGEVMQIDAGKLLCESMRFPRELDFEGEKKTIEYLSLFKNFSDLLKTIIYRFKRTTELKERDEIERLKDYVKMISNIYRIPTSDICLKIIDDMEEKQREHRAKILIAKRFFSDREELREFFERSIKGGDIEF